jgi:hypothetical protein
MGLLDTIGSALDRPWSATGATPEQISTNPWARRGMVLSAMGNQIIPAWEQGHKGFYPQLMVAGQAAREQDWQDQQRAYAVQQAQLAARQQAQLEQLFAGGGQAQQPAQAGPQAQLADPRLGPPGPTLQRASAPVSAAPAMTPQKAKAELYRKAAYMVAARSPEAAKKYMDLADQLDPREEYFAPIESADGLIQGTKYGGDPRMLGVKNKAPDLPPDVRAVEYVAGKPIGGTGAVGFETLKDYRKSGASNVSASAVSSKGDIAFAEQLAKDRAKQLAEEYPKAVESAGIIGGLNTVIQQSEKGTFSGPLAPGAIGAAQFMQSIGVPVAPDMLVSSRLTEAVINDLILRVTNAAGGARGFTAQEMPIIYNALPRLADDPQSRVAIARLLQRKAKDNIQRYKSLRDQSKNLPLFESFGTPDIDIPNATPANRPSLDQIFGK